MIRHALDLPVMNRTELERLYHKAEAGAIPDGPSEGVALLLPGTRAARPMAALVRLVGWRGKSFDRQAGMLLNRVTPFGILAIRARVYPGPSLLDGRPSLILDYSTTSWIARFVRDEIREVSPGVYLGYAYAFGIRWIAFALEFRDR